MYCSDCGAQLPEGARFCRECGAATGPETPAGAPPPAGRGRPSPETWIAIAAVGVVVIALAIVLPLLLLRGGDETTDTTEVASSTTVTAETSTTEPATTSTEPTTETTQAASSTTSSEQGPTIPGDSAGTWTETEISGLDEPVGEVAVSDEALLFQTSGGGGARMVAYLFDSGQTVALPVDAPVAGSPDVDGLLAVWWEATFDGDHNVTDAHVYAYMLPEGPKVEIASGTRVGSPKVSGSMITWTEGAPWATAPEEYWEISIFVTAVDGQGQPTGAAGTLVPSALAATLGDSTWTYGLSESFVAWEHQRSTDELGEGSYMMDLAELQPWLVGEGAWRPSLDGDTVAFTRNGIEVLDFGDTNALEIDGAGDYSSLAPSYVAYYKPVSAPDAVGWQVATRGLTGAHDQVLIDEIATPPWFQAPIATSRERVALVIDGVLHLFSWQGG